MQSSSTQQSPSPNVAVANEQNAFFQLDGKGESASSGTAAVVAAAALLFGSLGCYVTLKKMKKKRFEPTSSCIPRLLSLTVPQQATAILQVWFAASLLASTSGFHHVMGLMAFIIIGYLRLAFLLVGLMSCTLCGPNQTTPSSTSDRRMRIARVALLPLAALNGDLMHLLYAKKRESFAVWRLFGVVQDASLSVVFWVALLSDANLLGFATVGLSALSVCNGGIQTAACFPMKSAPFAYLDQLSIEEEAEAQRKAKQLEEEDAKVVRVVVTPRLEGSRRTSLTSPRSVSYFGSDASGLEAEEEEQPCDEVNFDHCDRGSSRAGSGAASPIEHSPSEAMAFENAPAASVAIPDSVV